MQPLLLVQSQNHSPLRYRCLLAYKKGMRSLSGRNVTNARMTRVAVSRAVLSNVRART